MSSTYDHAKRIKQELQEAGMTKYGRAKFASKYLPNLIHEREHVKAVVYGRYSEGKNSPPYIEGMLVATDRRIIFLDHKPGYTKMDEMTYDVIAGVKKTAIGLFQAVTLHSRLGDYTLRFVNARCASNFVRYVERRQVEAEGADSALPKTTPAAIEEKALDFLKKHDVAVLSTADRNGEVHGATVHYVIDDDRLIYILTKAGTQKVHDIFAHHQVALTVFEVDTAQTVQLQGIGEVEGTQAVKDRIFTTLIKPRLYRDDDMHLPPVTSLREGAFTVLRITPTYARFKDYLQLNDASLTADVPGRQ